MVLIDDGKGRGFKAEVDSSNQLKVFSVTESELIDRIEAAKGYSISSGILDLTNTSANGILYFKSNESNDVFVNGLHVQIGESAGATDALLIELIRNPSTGTLISDANTVTPVNFNFGSSDTLSGDSFLASAAAKTVTDGTVITRFLVPELGEYDVPFPLIILQKGNAVAVRITPATGNTSVDINVDMHVNID